MSDYIHFEGCVESVEWGRSVYTVLILPEDVEKMLSDLGAKRVEGEINDHPIDLGLSKADVIPGTFLWTGKSLLDAAGISPGEMLDVRLRPSDPNNVPLPDDVKAALLYAGKLDGWEALTPGKRRGLLHPVSTAKKPETRARRIAKLIETMA